MLLFEVALGSKGQIETWAIKKAWSSIKQEEKRGVVAKKKKREEIT